MGEGFREIRLGVFRLDVVEHPVELRHLSWTTLRRDEAAHPVAEGEHANFVAVALRHPGQQQRGVHRVVELGEQPGGRRHQPAAVERDNGLLPALGFHLHHHRAVAAGGGFPVDPAHLVARQVVAQAGESRGGTRRAGSPEPGHEAHPASQHQLIALDGEHVRINGRGLVGLDPHLADQPAARAPAAQVDRPEAIGTAVRRLDIVLDGEETIPIEDPGADASVRTQLRRDVVRDLCRKTGGTGMGDQ